MKAYLFLERYSKSVDSDKPSQMYVVRNSLSTGLRLGFCDVSSSSYQFLLKDIAKLRERGVRIISGIPLFLRRREIVRMEPEDSSSPEIKVERIPWY